MPAGEDGAAVDADLVAVLEHAHARRGDGLHAAVERVEALGPVDLRRARHELGGVDQVARGTRVGEQRGVWAAGQERARASRVVAAANGNAWKYHLPNGPVRAAAHTALRIGSRIAPGMMMRQFDWLYRHDVTKDS